MTTKQKLPNTLHELVALAIKDSRKLYDEGGYQPDAADWHTAVVPVEDDGDYCLICFAGSIIAGTLETDPSTSINDLRRELGDEAADKLFALNHIREGWYSNAVSYLYPYKIVKGDNPLSGTMDALEALESRVRVQHPEFEGWEEYLDFLDDIEHKVLPELQRLNI